MSTSIFVPRQVILSVRYRMVPRGDALTYFARGEVKRLARGGASLHASDAFHGVRPSWLGGCVLVQSFLSNDRLQELEEALSESRGLALAGQFAGFAVHEINGSLEAIANLLYLIRISAEDPEQVRKYSNLLEEQLEILNAISRQTLSFYRLNETSEAIPVSPLADAAIRIQQHKITAKKIRLLKKLPDHVTVKGSSGAMLQVFSNLIGNAIEALSIEGTIQLRARSANGETHILVADNGRGIPAAIHPRIFEPFFSTKKERGTGLGLAIVKAIVEKHHGKIRSWTSTRVGMSGTAFRISLPAHENSQTIQSYRRHPEMLRGPIVV